MPHRGTEWLKRYELFGWDFAESNPLSEEEVGWYLRYAHLSGGPVLELACGTGRLLCRLAEEGFRATGVDLSRTMTDIARDNAASLPEAVQLAIRILQDDMSSFALDEQFGLIYIAGNSFRELCEPEKQLSCLRSIAHHLRDDGVFLMTERRYDPSWFQGGKSRTSEWTEPVTHPETGDVVRRRFALDLSEDGRWITGEFLYRVQPPDGAERLEVCPILAPVMSIADYEDVFATAGFAAQLYVGYEHRSDDGVDPILCFVCGKI